MAGRKLHLNDCNKQSLMTVLSNFVEAVNAMDDRVMIPSKLRDMEVRTDGPKLVPMEENNNMSVLPVSVGRGEDLYNYFVMINAIKREIVTGTSSNSGSGSEMESDLSESDDEVKDNARKTAEAFRHHLQGLFGLLNEMTETAKFLGDVYEGQVNSSRKERKFAI